MPAIREHDPFLDDYDDMPPLVENPNPSMTFTFVTEPQIHSYDGSEMPPPLADPASTMFIMSPPCSPSLTPTRSASSKRRDASHIPRPPNAFILFRSSFIKAQHIPDKIEGNHSSLSKIIGMYWKTLPTEQRKVWEAKAVAAQSEHRQKYPDWRFRPGNVIGKVKDGPRKRGNKKGRGEAEAEEKNRQKRCAKIARFLEEGMTGANLEDAMREYDRKTIPARAAKVKQEPSPALQDDMRLDGDCPGVGQAKDEKGCCRPRAKTVAPSINGFKVPLTAMFKRSSSVPAITTRVASPDNAYCSDHSLDTLNVASPFIIRNNAPGSHEDGISDVSPMLSPAIPSLPAHELSCNVPFLTAEFLYSPPSLENDVGDYGSPASSTMDYTRTPDLVPGAIRDELWNVNSFELPEDMPDKAAVPFVSRYSSLIGWAGDYSYEQRHMTFEADETEFEESSKPFFQSYSDLDWNLHNWTSYDPNSDYQIGAESTIYV